MKKIFYLILSLFIISGCSTLQGLGGLQEEAAHKYTQAQIERELTNNTNLTNQNITIANSLIDAIANIQRLQNELDQLSMNVDTINSQIEDMQNDTTLTPESIEYLAYITELTGKSNLFILELQTSTHIWNNYINKLSRNSSNLNFSDDNSQTIADTITKPIEAFE